MSKSNNVKLTEEAHYLLAEMAEDCDTTMRELASEAVMRMAMRKRDERQYKFGAFALGAITGGALMLFVGMVI